MAAKQKALQWHGAEVATAPKGAIILASSPLCPNQAMRVGSLLRGYIDVSRTPAFWAYALPGALSYASLFVFLSGSAQVLIAQVEAMVRDNRQRGVSECDTWAAFTKMLVNQ